MSAQQSYVKQIATVRRKPDMTRKEYFDHRFQIHGAITDSPADDNQKPTKYIQAQIFDSAYGARSGHGPPNKNHPWCGRDDTTELYFRDWDHVASCFNSEHVAKKVKPDALFFADLETSISMMAAEKEVPMQTALSKQGRERVGDGNDVVAMWFVSTTDNDREGEALDGKLTPMVRSALEKYGSNDVRGMQVNVGIVSSKFDLNAYFGGSGMPQYALVYKVFLKDASSVPAFRKAQKAIAEEGERLFDGSESFVVFAKEVLVMDVTRDVKFDPSRQPVFDDLPGPTHLAR